MAVQRMTRREVLQRAPVAGLVVVAAGCTPTSSPTPVPQSEAPSGATAEPADTAQEPTKVPATPAPARAITIQYWCQWNPTYAEQTWQQLMATDEFKAIMGSSTLEVRGQVTNDVLLTSVAGGAPPTGASCPNYSDYMGRGVLIPIDPWVATSSTIVEENYLAPYWKRASYKGVLYGAPINTGFTLFALNYNARMVADAGLNPDQPPATWEECFEWHRALTKFDKAGNLLQIGLDPYDAVGGNVGDANGFFPACSWGLEWFDDKTGQFNLDNDEMAQSFEVMGEFYKLAGPDKMAAMREVQGQGGWGASFNAEVQAMIIEGPWHPGETMVQVPEVAQHNRATWAPVPASRKGVKIQSAGGHYIIFFKDYKDLEGSELLFKVAEFANSQKACDIIYNAMGWLSGSLAYLQTADRDKYPGLEFYFRSMDEATEWEKAVTCPIIGFVRTEMAKLREEVFRGNMTGAAAAKELQKRCEDQYKAAGVM